MSRADDEMRLSQEREADERASAEKSLAAQALGKRGGLRRAAVTAPERRSEIARIAAISRWAKQSDD